MNLKHAIKNWLRKNASVWEVYRKIAYKRADFREWKEKVFPIWKVKLKERNVVFLVMTPQHGNLGDHAIALAEQRMLDSLGIPYFEITGKHLSYLQRKNHGSILNGRVILAQGGGNLGTLWFGAEESFRRLIAENPDSAIFCHPNTIYYEDSMWGQEELKKSILVYNAHSSLKLYARETLSFDFMHPIYTDVQLSPDMVLSLDAIQLNLNRKGCLLCLRMDCEKTRTPEAEHIIVEQAKNLFGQWVSYTDMCVAREIMPDQRTDAVMDKLREFAGAELVITDRLHGMIFCAVTGTPCIVINSKSPKVRGCYQWMEKLEYIKFCEDPAQIVSLYRSIPQTTHVYTNDHLMHYYDKLKADILSAVRR